MVFVILFFSLSQAAQLLFDLFVTHWACDLQQRQQQGPPQHQSCADNVLVPGSHDNAWWITLLGLLLLGCLLLSLVRSLIGVAFSARSSWRLHEIAVQSLLRNPLLWFQQVGDLWQLCHCFVHAWCVSYALFVYVLCVICAWVGAGKVCIVGAYVARSRLHTNNPYRIPRAEH